MKMRIGLSAMFLMGAGILFAGPAENLKQADKNQDGVLQEEEFIAMHVAWNKASHTPYDEKEFAEWFKDKDRNKDGVLSVDELSAQ